MAEISENVSKTKVWLLSVFGGDIKSQIDWPDHFVIRWYRSVVIASAATFAAVFGAMQATAPVAVRDSRKIVEPNSVSGSILPGSVVMEYAPGAIRSDSVENQIVFAVGNGNEARLGLFERASTDLKKDSKGNLIDNNKILSTMNPVSSDVAAVIAGRRAQYHRDRMQYMLQQSFLAVAKSTAESKPLDDAAAQDQFPALYEVAGTPVFLTQPVDLNNNNQPSVIVRSVVDAWPFPIASWDIAVNYERVQASLWSEYADRFSQQAARGQNLDLGSVMPFAQYQAKLDRAATTSFLCAGVLGGWIGYVGSAACLALVFAVTSNGIKRAGATPRPSVEQETIPNGLFPWNLERSVLAR